MYARYDAIVAQDEAEERAREEASRVTEAVDEDAKRRFLASLPSHMRSDPHILRSLDSSA